MEKLKELMDRVLNPDGTVKACGREVCSALIAECNMIYPDKDFGTVETGTMNVSAIVELRNRIV